MSLDTRIAAAIEELERQTFVDATAGLARLRETHRRRRNTRAGTVAVALVLLAAGAFWRLGGPASKPEPAPVVPRVSNGVLVSIAPTGGKAVAVGGLIAHLPVGMPTWAGHLTWSSDGSQLVHDTSSGNLVALDVETGDVRILTTCSTPCLAGASRDTTLIAVAADDELTVRTPEASRWSRFPVSARRTGVVTGRHAYRVRRTDRPVRRGCGRLGTAPARRVAGRAVARDRAVLVARQPVAGLPRWHTGPGQSRGY